jgi:hypothetical protein
MVTIVDRFGHQVFKTNDPTKGWDGNIKDMSDGPT